MSKINDIVFFYNTIEENTEQSFAPTEDVFLGIIAWGVRNALQFCINRIDLLQYIEDDEDLFYHYDVETKMVNDKKGDLVSGHRSVIYRVSFDGNTASVDNITSINHRVDRFVNEVVKHLSQ